MATPKFTVESPEVIKRCGTPVPNAHSIYCPLCGTPEVFCDKNNPENQEKWFWAIRAFRVDNYSECKSCGNWFAS